MANSSLLIHPHEFSKSWVERMVKNKIPTLGFHPVGGKKACESLKDLIKRCSQKDFRDLVDYAIDQGIQIEYEMHSMSYLLPREMIVEKPEWFRINKDGERTDHCNCCASNDDALDFIAERAAELAKSLYKSSDRYFFWLDDTKNAACYCDKCKGMSASDQQLKILNHILRRLKKDNPNAKLAYLAYFECIKAPEKVKPEKGIFLEYAPYERDFHKPIEGNEQQKYLPELLKMFDNDTAKVLDYWYDNSLFSEYKEVPKEFSVDKDALYADFKYYRKLGFNDIGSFACYFGDDYTKLYGEVDISDFSKAYYDL